MKQTTPSSKRSGGSQGDHRLTSGAADDLAGVRLGRYELLFLLASGGMGAVYAGRVVGREGIGRVVAVKVMLNRNPDNADLQAFLSEARVTARLDHPNVVRTIELGEDQGTLFIAMELVRGQSLRTVLATLGRDKRHLPFGIIARVMIQAANGLHAAHELRNAEGVPLNLIHRDLSPDNILLAYSGQVFVSDFGVAKLSNTASTHTGVVKGKFAYMSPEQVNAEPLDRRSDIFTLGILLWEALTGRRLFKGGTPRETVALILGCSVKNPKTLRANVPERLAAITLRCLEHDADQRYATAKEVADELRTCVKVCGIPSDEGDLTELLESLFGKERAELDVKLDGTELAAKSSPAERRSGSAMTEAFAQMPEATGGTLASAVSDAHSRPKIGRFAAIVTLGAMLGALTVFVIGQVTRQPRELRAVLGGARLPGGLPSASTRNETGPREASPGADAAPGPPAVNKRPVRHPAAKAPSAPSSRPERQDDLFENL